MKIEKGAKITVRDIRKNEIIAEGVVVKTDEQGEVQFAYLDSGYFISQIPAPVVRESE